ncbi:MAG TPA: TetR/AcrR family transcriptional regulator [Anaerolineaceae bacterium]|nr:TetR/AcrR family transcriptional regulator [Anaerolineaceae bacterium]HPN53531.1 TetR/AcrR family transcriptional regulator [Anaerolineaceae bacterium]
MHENNRTDRRITRTREAIRIALIELIEEKGFDAISVSDITIRANINRGTFYLHYKDKFDLLDQTEGEIIQHVESLFQQAGSINMNNPMRFADAWPVIVTFFEYLKENAALMRAVLGLKGEMALQTQIHKAATRKIIEQGYVNQIPMEDLMVPAEYLISYVVSAHLGVIQVWLTNGCKESPREMAQILSKITFHGPFHAIRWRQS